MTTRTDRQRPDRRYTLRFAVTAALLVAGTLVLVLYVLPQRYVLSSGFREGAMSFPNPATPFDPGEILRVAARPRPPQPPPPPLRGAAELFWEQVLPLLRAERYVEALPLFEAYLALHAGDLGARREYGITLAAAGRGADAARVLTSLLEHESDRDLRLLLARVLRDERRVEEASTHYRWVVESAPEDEEMALEWARALAWVEDYPEAEAVLSDALARRPESIALRAELARVHYYDGLLVRAGRILEEMTEAELLSVDALALRAAVRAALAPPPLPYFVTDSTVEGPEAPRATTLVEAAMRAREADDFARADSLYRAALADAPDDALAWQAYADLLQYEMEDFEGALEALLTVVRITDGDDPALQYRIALLEVWTERTDDARFRLERILGLPDVEPPATPVSRADVLALLGDLERWAGRRLAAVGRYEAALAEDPQHESGLAGLTVLRSEVARELIESERPGMGALAETLVDTDDFVRVDLGGSWRGIHDEWVWSTRTGSRWLEGVDLGGPGDRQGLFAELEGARWWRWGTVRTGARLGVQNVRTDATDVAVGLSARIVGGSGARTDLRVDHEPAYVGTSTLQALAADVAQDRISLAHGRSLGERWSLAVSAEAASLDHRGVAASDRNTRLAAGASVGRSLSPRLVLGLSARALRYTDAAPDVTGISLYWDPSFNASAGPYVQFTRPVGSAWEMRARLSPAVAYIVERGAADEITPDLSASLGLARDGAKYRTELELFYGQGRFSGYRMFGANVSFSAVGWLGRGGR